jgi:hypothetical protein
MLACKQKKFLIIVFQITAQPLPWLYAPDMGRMLFQELYGLLFHMFKTNN